MRGIVFVVDGVTLVLATKNPGKVAELRRLVAPNGIEVRSLVDDESAPDVVEDAPTLRGNALKKALTIAQYAKCASLADDTGLDVDALNGAPGVRSARFAGEDATDADNRKKLLAALDGAPSRSARFRTVLCYVLDDGEPAFFEGVCEGIIIDEERGEQGFGYDSVFVPRDGDGRTFAEMSAEEKNRLSHRAKALEQFVDAVAGGDPGQ